MVIEDIILENALREESASDRVKIGESLNIGGAPNVTGSRSGAPSRLDSRDGDGPSAGEPGSPGRPDYSSQILIIYLPTL